MTLEQLVHEVGQWHLIAFGGQSMNKPLANKLREEACEFRDEVCLENDASEEAADVLIVLCAYAFRNKIDLIAEAEKKLEKIKGRDQVARDKDRGILPADFEVMR